MSKKHGGAREGSGAKKKSKDEKKVSVPVTIDRDLSEKAKATGNRSGLVNDLLRKWDNQNSKK